MLFSRILPAICSLLLLATTAMADSLVLIHGYISSGETWHRSGVTRVLTANGWAFAGHFAATAFFPVAGNLNAANRFYTVDLPYASPVENQAGILSRYLEQVKAMHPGEPIILAGHSAGGVVARMALVMNPMPDIKALITIASPHVGTPLAVRGLRETSSSGPVGILKGFFGGKTYHTVRRSRGLLVSLLPPSRWNMLGWLNVQPHPAIQYFSVIRRRGDGVVPPYSEDMNQVPALAGRSQVILSNAGHGLNMEDGVILVDILNRIQSPGKSTESQQTGT